MNKHEADHVTMSAGGLYSLATRGAKDVIDKAIPRAIAAVATLDLDNNRFAMADMGCADGGTSLDLIRAILSHLTASHPDLQGSVLYADQPANDFNALMQIVHGRTRFETWLPEFPGIHPLASGCSFYLQTVPDETLDFVFSATAMHWLSGLPVAISDHVHMVGASGAELDAFATQAKRDWETILMARAKELKPGGKMVLVNFCRDDAGRYLGHTGGVNMFATLDELWRQFVDEGRVSIAEYQRMTLPQYYHTVAQFSAPLLDDANPCYRAGLRLDNIETAIVKCPFATAFNEHGDAQQFAAGLIPTIRSWNQSIFRAALDRSRPEAEKDALIDAYYAAYHRRVCDNPEGHGMDYVHAYMTIAKTGGG